MRAQIEDGHLDADQARNAGENGGIHESELLLEAIVETSPDGLITIDADGTIRSFNPAAERLFHYQAAEVVGRNVTVLMSEHHARRHDGYLRHYLETGQKRIIGIGREVTGRRRDGGEFPMELAVGEVRFRGAPVFAGFVRDVSQRREATERLAELQAELTHVSRLSAMGEMASALAHELNQPLTAVANYTQAVRRLHIGGGGHDERIRDLLGKATEQASRAGAIIHRLRRFLAKGETERSYEPVNAVIREAGDLALLGARNQGIDVRFDLADDLPPVLIDRIHINQVVTNLIRNAVDALEAAPHRVITLRSRRDGGDVEVTVADSGPGLSPGVRARLFEPFVTTKRTGMGIGLSICRSIIEAHGGRIWADPAGEGGASFRFTLPADGPGDGGA